MMGRRTSVKPSPLDIALAREYARHGAAWEEIEAIVQSLLWFSGPKERYKALVGKTYRCDSAGIPVTSTIAKYCLRKLDKIQTIKLTMNEVMSIRLSASKGFSYREIKDTMNLSIPLSAIEKIVYGELFEWWPGPIKFRKNITPGGISRSDKKILSDNLKKIQSNAVNPLDVKSLSESEEEIIRVLKEIANGLKSKQEDL